LRHDLLIQLKDRTQSLTRLDTGTISPGIGNRLRGNNLEGTCESTDCGGLGAQRG
jgi:hypothetical protein